MPKRLITLLLCACLIVGCLPIGAGAARVDVSNMDGFLKKLLIDGLFYNYDCETIAEKSSDSSISYADVVTKLCSFPSCIDADYSMSSNAYGLNFKNEGYCRTLPLEEAKWLFQTIFNWSDSTWENMLTYANSRGGYLDQGKKYVYIKNNKLYCSGGDRGDWPNRLKQVAKRQDGSRVEVVLDWYTSDEYYGTANKLARRIYALLEQKTVNGKAYWTVRRTKKLGAKENPLAVAGFDDVSPADFFAEAVSWGAGKGIVNGTGAATFSPGKACTREEIVTFLWRSAGKPEPVSLTNPFGDVKSDSFAYKAILWANEKGITSGTKKGKFSPKDICKRSEAMTFMWRAAGKPESAGKAFSDVPAGAYFEGAVAWAVDNGITSGVGGNKFAPDKACTRGEIVTFLYRAAS